MGTDTCFPQSDDTRVLQAGIEMETAPVLSACLSQCGASLLGASGVWS